MDIIMDVIEKTVHCTCAAKPI